MGNQQMLLDMFGQVVAEPHLCVYIRIHETLFAALRDHLKPAPVAYTEGGEFIANLDATIEHLQETRSEGESNALTERLLTFLYGLPEGTCDLFFAVA